MFAALRRLGRRLHEERWLLAIVVAAFVVRLHWNLEVHPPGDYIYSDMNGYIERANALFDRPAAKWEYASFYPWGTHVLLWALQRILGRGDWVALGVAYAAFGAIAVGYAYALARRATRYPWVAPALGLVLVAYYPLISLGGYFLSEIPFSVCMVAATFHLVRLSQLGRNLDALWAGTWSAAAFVIRPQILLSLAIFGLLWLLTRRWWPKIRARHLFIAAIPLVAIALFSIGRLHYHTGRWGLISENGIFNQVFGRCHNNKIIAHPDTPERRRTSFGPPPLIQLAKRAEAHPGEWPQLNPAIGLELEYRGYIGDEEKLGHLIDQCVEATGWRGQIEYGVVNAVMLWRYNITWPDSGKSQWRGIAAWWSSLYNSLFAIPSILAVCLAWWPRRHLALALASVHLLAIVPTAVIYFGDTRLRTSYDPVLIWMALEVAAMALAGVWWLLRRVRGKGPR